MQSVAALPGPLEVDASGVGDALFRFEVVERRPNDGERRADLVRELARERSQITCVFVQAREQRREASGHIAQLVRRLRFREGRDDALARQGVLAGLAQAGQAQRQMRGEDEHCEHEDSARDQRDVEQLGKRVIAQREPVIDSLAHSKRADHALAVPVINRSRDFDHAALAGLVQQASVEQHENRAAVLAVGRRQGERVRHGELRAVGGRDGEAQSGLVLEELIQVAGQLGRCGDQPALCGEVIAAKRAVAAGDRAHFVTVVDEHAKAAAQKRERNAQLDAIALLGRAATRCRCGARPPLPAGRIRAFRCAGHARRPVRSAARKTCRSAPVVSSKPIQTRSPKDAGSSRLGVRRVEDHLVVAHFELRVEHAIAHAGEDAEAIVAVIEVLPGAGRVGPLLDVAVDEGLAGQRNGNEVVTLRLRKLLAGGAAVEQLITALQ